MTKSDKQALSQFIHGRLVDHYYGGAKLSDIITDVIVVCWPNKRPDDPINTILEAIKLDDRMQTIKFLTSNSGPNYFIYIP